MVFARRWRNQVAAIAGAVASAALAFAAPAVAAGGDLLVVDQSAFPGFSGGVIRVDPATGARTTVSANGAPAGGPSFNGPSGVVFAADGSLLVVNKNAFAGGGGGIIRVDRASGARTTVSENAAPTGGPSFVDPVAIAIAPDGALLVADQNAFDGTGGVIRVDPATGARTAVSSNAAPAGGPTFDDPAGIAVAADGALLVTDLSAYLGFGGVLRVDPVTGLRTTLSANSAPTGDPKFENPFAILRPAVGALLVTDLDGLGDPGGGVMRVDPTTGARTAVSSNPAPMGGPSFENVSGIAVAGNGELIVLDYAAGSGGSVIRVDPLTGSRSLISANAQPAGGPSFSRPFAVVLEPAGPPPPPPPPAEPAAQPPPRPAPTPPPGQPVSPDVVPQPPPRLTITDVVRFPDTGPCASRRSFKIRLRIPRGATVRSATVRVNGRQVAVVRSDRLRAPVDLRNLPKGRFSVTIVVRLADGRQLSGTRRYRTCVPRQRGGRPRL